MSDGHHFHNKCTNRTREADEDCIVEVVHPRSKKSDVHPNRLGGEAGRQQDFASRCSVVLWMCLVVSALL